MRRNSLAAALAMFSGLLLISTGWVGGPGLLGTMLEFASRFFENEIGLVIQLALNVLVFLGSLGGVAVMFGGFLILRRRITSGRFFIWIGSGITIFGLSVTLVLSLQGGLTQMVELVLSVIHSAGWIGAILSLVARGLAKKP